MKHYLLIGASSGIGKELALQLADNKNKVIDYSITCDFKSMYGNNFAYLINHQPDLVIIAEGSAVTVNWKRNVFKNT